MKISKQARRDGKQLFRGCMADGRLEEAKVRETVRLVLERKPRGWLAVLTHFQRLVKLELDRRTARVESVVALDDHQQGRMKDKLEALYGAGLNFEFVQNARLLGGLRVRVGSDVYDGSVETRLAALEQSF
ncbi:MAG: F0F1 ATP synthase subunit delta [Verrucomicrobia bacterium]|jgi:F-type H+-transporting ATPase subunit delta|nr:F0F1 ATP synthase subunit delta [Verrucomicrobiota bacterium]